VHRTGLAVTLPPEISSGPDLGIWSGRPCHKWSALWQPPRVPDHTNPTMHSRKRPNAHEPACSPQHFRRDGAMAAGGGDALVKDGEQRGALLAAELERLVLALPHTSMDCTHACVFPTCTPVAARSRVLRRWLAVSSAAQHSVRGGNCPPQCHLEKGVAGPVL
jgi:hypothetical protein